MASLFNFADPLMIALKAVTSISGNAVTDEDIKKQRAGMELAGRLAAPSDGILIRPFTIGEMSCEEVTPEFAYNPKYAILYAHGGGYTCGGISYARILAAKLANATGFTVFSFAYRLCPENKFPAQFEDISAMYEEILEMGYKPENLLFSGDSAGGNLVLCFAQQLHKTGGTMPKAMLLFSPWTDLTATQKSYEFNKDKDPTITREYVEGIRDIYVLDGEDPGDPKYSPLFGDFTGFPPTFIMVGQNELLYNDSEKLYENIEAAGGVSKLDVEEGGWHVYQQVPLPMANRAMKRLSRFVTETIYKCNKPEQADI